MGAPTGGTGKDADGGTERDHFEAERRKRMQGGKDRPPVYKPQDDGQRGGYTNRSKPIPPRPEGRQAPRESGTLRTDAKPIISPEKKRKIPNPGSSMVRGLVR
jgi:hypothetical protein